MVPNPRWFPLSLQERAAWCNNFGAQFTDLAVSLGFTAADAAANKADCDMVVGIAAIVVKVEAYAKAMRQFRINITESDIGDVTPAIPDLPNYTVPTSVPAGIYERIDLLVKRIRVSPTYTPEAGALLGIVGATPSRPAPEDMQPVVKATAQPGSVVQVKFIRGEMQGVVIETRLDNAETWSVAGQYSISPANLTIPNIPGNQPRTVQLRARYLESDAPVGQYSDIVTTYTQPAG